MNLQSTILIAVTMTAALTDVSRGKVYNWLTFPAALLGLSLSFFGWKSVYQLNNLDEFFEKHAETEQLVMMLQEDRIKFEEYYHCYCIGGKYVRIMPYEPRNPHHLRYVADSPPALSAIS